MSTLSPLRTDDPAEHSPAGAEPGGPPADLDLDLDLPAPSAADRPWRRRQAVVLTAAGMLAGAGLAALTGPPPPAPPPDVVTQVALAGTDLAPGPIARLSVTVRNTGGSPARIGPLWVSGGGLPNGPLTLDQAVGQDVTLAAGQVRTLTTSARLVCPAPRSAGTGSGGGDPSGRLEASLEVVSGRRAVRAVAVTSGDLGREGGACAAAMLDLPRGWQDAAQVSSVRVSGQSLEVTLPRMPGAYLRVVAVRADGWFLPSDTLGQNLSAGQVFVHLDRPSPACWDIGKAPRIATGLEIMLVDGHSGLVETYVEVGPVLARWLAQAYTAGCPAQSLVASPDP